MGGIKGTREYTMFKENKSLTRKQAMLAHCYMCNGEEESAIDCQGKGCPMYQYQHYRGKVKSIAHKSATLETKE